MLLNKSINYKIDFVLRATLLIKKIYNVSREEEEIIKTYLNNIKNKNFIRNSISQYATFILIVKKLNRELRVCVNYRAFNALTIKNCNTSSLIKETL